MQNINNDNLKVLTHLLDYLKTRPDDIYEELVNNVKQSGVNEEHAYALLLNSFLGLDDEYVKKYISFMVRKEKMDKYLNNPFYQKMDLEKQAYNNLEIDYSYIESYELYMLDEIDKYFDGRLFAQVGFSEDFLKCLTIYDRGKVLDRFSPLLVNASIIPLEKAKGKVAIFGLGIGYFAYMAHLKEKVKQITIYESNGDLIDLFKKYFLSKFDHKEKIKIVKKDPLSVLKNMNSEINANFIYINLWNNLEDGLKEYPRYQQLERIRIDAKTMYYLEESIKVFPKEENDANN